MAIYRAIEKRRYERQQGKRELDNKLEHATDKALIDEMIEIRNKIKKYEENNQGVLK